MTCSLAKLILYHVIGLCKSPIAFEGFGGKRALDIFGKNGT